MDHKISTILVFYGNKLPKLLYYKQIQQSKILRISNKDRMQQLQVIFWQRNTDITQLQEEGKQIGSQPQGFLKQKQRERQKQKQGKKQQFQQRERNRVQRQNWIIKIIKTIKVLSTENKKNIYESVVRMMSYYSGKATEVHKPSKIRVDTACLDKIQDGNSTQNAHIDFQRNFTQQLINLFINFYNQYGITDLTPINPLKKILRPNNTFITTDLIKQLVQTHRQYFKVKFLQAFNREQNKLQQKSRVKLQPISLQVRREIPITEPSETQESKKEEQLNKDVLHQYIKEAIYEKWQHYLNYNLPNQRTLKEKINDAYQQLLERNAYNNFMINKFQQKCHGKPKGFSYNISGLYTQQQIKKMQSKLKADINQKYLNIKQLRGDPTAEQLKQYFKIKVQIQDNHDKIEKKKQNTQQINSWLPLIVQKTGFQHCPLNLYIVFSKELVPIDEFQEKCGISIKNYFTMVLRNIRQQQRRDRQQMQINLKNFKRHIYLDLNHSKKKQLMSYQHRVYQKVKKQSIFPLLKHNQLRQQTQIALKNRSMSEYKLAPIFKNYAISKRLQIEGGQNMIESNSYGNIQQSSLSKLMPKADGDAIEGREMEKPAETKSAQIAKPASEIRLKQFTTKNSKLKFLQMSQKQKWMDRLQTIKDRRSKIDSIIDKIISQRNLTVTN